MSFASDMKNELSRIAPEDDCCEIAELSALMRMSATVLFGGKGRIGLNFTTESASLARRMFRLLKRQNIYETQVVVSRVRRLGRHNSYEVKAAASPEVRELFTKLGAPEEQGFTGLGQSLLRKGCCRRAFLRGAFLGGGSINRPERGYHLELATSDEAFARLLFQTMKAFGLAVKMSNRKQGRVIYLKEGDAITSFLRLVGAHDTLLAFENVRVVKDMRNQINRLVNCDTANLSKTVNASVRQVDNIRFILETTAYKRLPAKLREAAELRLAYPDASLQELVDIVGGDITKSGMNHRLRSLEKLADELRNGVKS